MVTFLTEYNLLNWMASGHNPSESLLVYHRDPILALFSSSCLWMLCLSLLNLINSPTPMTLSFILTPVVSLTVYFSRVIVKTWVSGTGTDQFVSLKAFCDDPQLHLSYNDLLTVICHLFHPFRFFIHHISYLSVFLKLLV